MIIVCAVNYLSIACITKSIILVTVNSVLRLCKDKSVLIFLHTKISEKGVLDSE